MASGNKLKELIKEKNISVAELSRKTEISAQTLYSTINRDGNMSFETLKKIAAALNVSIYELTGESCDKSEDVNMYQLGYNKAIDDLMNALCDHCMQQINECYKLECPFCTDGCDIINIAEQLKK